MPAVRASAGGERRRMLHERDALPLDRVRDERLRRVPAGSESRERGAQFGVIVPVARLDLPAERAQLPLEITERQDLVGRPVRLQLVAVDDDPEPAETLVRRRLERFPVLALLQLSVARHHHDDPFPSSRALPPGDAATLRDAHAQRARVRLDARNADVRVAVEAAQPAEAQKALARDHAEPVQRRVQTGHVVPLRREEDVTAGIVEADLGDVQLRVQEVNDDVERAEARSEVSGACALDGHERVQPAHVREERELSIGLARRGANTIDVALRDGREPRHARDGNGRSGDCRSW